jgi:hypothetical protein
MKTAARPSSAPELLILIGSCGFILMLFIAAVWEPKIRWLHFFQAWMYITALVWSFRKSRWGYLIGFSAAGFWDYVNVFTTTFFFNGLQQLAHWVHSGHLDRPDLLIAVPAFVSNLLVVAGSLWGYSQLHSKSSRDGYRLLIALILTTGYFALDMAIFQPGYLGLFPQLLHPRLP